MSKIKPAYLIIIFAFFAFLLILGTRAATGFSLTDYQNYINQAKATYQAALDQAQAQYQAVLAQANQYQSDALTQVSEQFSSGQISEEDYNSELSEIQTYYNQTIQNAQEILKNANQIAYNTYQAQRKYAWDQYLGRQASAPATTALPSQTAAQPFSSSIIPGATGSNNNGSSGTTPTNSSVTVKTITPQAFNPRYGVACGIPSGESLNAGETKYYKIDMANWIGYTRASYAQWKSVNLVRSYNSCVSGGAAALASYNQKCSNGAICQAYSCWPSCDTTKPLASCSDYASWVWAFGSSYCANPPDANYAANCAAGRDREIAKANAELAQYETLFASGNSNSVFDTTWGMPLYFGYDAYVGSWGSGGGPFKLAIGYDKVPVYEDLVAAGNTDTTTHLHIDGLPVLSSSNQMTSLLNMVSSEYLAETTFAGQIKGASALYLMLHNSGTSKWDFLLGFPCPTGVAK